MLKKLERYCKAQGGDSKEGSLLWEIRQDAREYCRCKFDQNGNLLCLKGDVIKTVIYAETEKVYLIADHFTSDGKVHCLIKGTENVFDFAAKKIVFPEHNVLGIVCGSGGCADGELSLDRNGVYADIGALSAEQAKSMIEIGDFAVLCGTFDVDGNRITSDVLDTRISALVLTELMKMPRVDNTLFVFKNVTSEMPKINEGILDFPFRLIVTKDFPPPKEPLLPKMMHYYEEDYIFEFPITEHHDGSFSCDTRHVTRACVILKGFSSFRS